MAPTTKSDIDLLRLDLTLKAKNGLNFIVAAAIVWLAISFVWTLPYNITTRAVITFYAGALMLPLAWLLSKLMDTSWNMPDNPLQPLGLWLNFAQLGYFPILVFVFLKAPEQFLMVYVVITGAHFLPYTWFYNTNAFAVIAAVVSIGAVWLQLVLPVESLYMIPLFLSVALLVLGVWLFLDYRAKLRSVSPEPSAPS